MNEVLRKTKPKKMLDRDVGRLAADIAETGAGWGSASSAVGGLLAARPPD
jgi:hypothetical protein